MTTVHEEALAPVVHAIYAAGEQSIPWSYALEKIADLLDARDTSIIFVDWERQQHIVTESVRAAPETVQAYNQHWHRHDPWLQCGHPLVHTDDVVFASQEILPEDELRASPFYREFLAPAGLSQMLALNVLIRGPLMAAVVCMYAEDAGERTAGQFAAARALLPHLRQALLLHRRINASEEVTRASLAVLERATVAMIVIDGAGRISFSNEAAHRLLSTGDGLGMAERYLVAARRSAQQRLQRRIRQCIRTHRRAGIVAGGIERIPRPSGKLDYVVEVQPMSDYAGFAASRDAAALVVVTDPVQHMEVEMAAVASAFGLTAMEARVVKGLAEGQETAALAVALDMSAHTLRTHVKNVYRKLSVSSRAGLMRMVLSALPTLRVLDGNGAAPAPPPGRPRR